MTTREKHVLSPYLYKGRRLIVRIKDQILCGKYRGNGDYWYVCGTVEHVSHKYGYVQVTFTNLWGELQKGRVFTLKGMGSWGYIIDPENHTKITIKDTTDRLILLPLNDEYTQIIIRQDLIDQIRETPYQDWEHLTNAQLWDVVHLLMNAKKEDSKR